MSEPRPDETYMQECLREAEAAAAAGEVPIGAVVVLNGEIVGRGRNSPIARSDPTAHAEILALRAAAARVGNYRLPAAELFVTVEPCLMCVGAVLQARLRRVVFACADPKAGALGSVADFSDDPRLSHRFLVARGPCEREAGELLRAFFRERRER
jgi:tRNA(adenine34) deaminase